MSLAQRIQRALDSHWLRAARRPRLHPTHAADELQATDADRRGPCPFHATGLPDEAVMPVVLGYQAEEYDADAFPGHRWVPMQGDPAMDEVRAQMARLERLADADEQFRSMCES